MFEAWYYVIALLGLVVLLVCAKALLGLVSIRETQVGIVVKKFRLGGAGLPNGRIVALNGEPGFQSDTLAPDLHFWQWPWPYRIDKGPVIVVPPGVLGLVNARDGDSVPVNRILSSAVACDDLQEALRARERLGGSSPYCCATWSPAVLRCKLQGKNSPHRI